MGIPWVPSDKWLMAMLRQSQQMSYPHVQWMPHRSAGNQGSTRPSLHRRHLLNGSGQAAKRLSDPTLSPQASERPGTPWGLTTRHLGPPRPNLGQGLWFNRLFRWRECMLHFGKSGAQVLKLLAFCLSFAWSTYNQLLLFNWCSKYIYWKLNRGIICYM